MKAARVVVLAIALGAGGVAAILATGSSAPPPAAPQVAKQLDTVEVLVARADIGLGNTVKPADIGWEVWPASAAGPQFINRANVPDGPERVAGAIARTAFAKGEPIREAKLIKADGSGFMAAMLSPGMRAMSIEISPETGAGGFILPNDRVDVILTRSRTERQDVAAETVLANVRVLAIDQTIEEKNGEKVVVGKTATLELASAQAESLAQARQSGRLSLVLRALVDTTQEEKYRGAVTFVRYGVSSTAPR